MRRFAPIAALLAVLLSAVVSRGASPDRGTVQPPSGKSLVGPKTTWSGETFAVGVNQDFVCDDTHPCDMFHLTVPVAPSYWATTGGGVAVAISGYDENQDFDLFVYQENADGSLGKVAASSAGPTGQAEKAIIKKASGKYVVVVYPYQVVNATYTGAAFFELADIKRPPVVTDPPGLPVVRASVDKYISHSEPSIAMNPLNHNNLVAGSKMYTNLERYKFKIGTYYSMDGGRSWRDVGRLPGYPEDDAHYTVSDISMAFDDEGNAYAFVLDSAPGWSGMNVHISRDGGKSWSNPIVVHRYDYANENLPALIFDDKNWIVADNTGADHDGTVGNIYTCWNLDITFPVFAATIVVSRSTDGGASWGTPVPIHTPGDDVIGCQVLVAPNGDLFVFWADYGNGEIRWVKSTDHGQTFTLPAAVSTLVLPRRLPNTQFRNPIFPSAAVVPDGTITVVWEDGRFSAHETQRGDADIAMSRSSDGGATWSAPVRINDDKLGNGADQIQPWLAASEKGKLAAMWFDRRHDPSNTYLDTYVGLSSNGTTWRNVRVTQKLWDSSINPPRPGGSEFIGDYQGIVADEDVAIPFWNDTTTGEWQEVFSARVPFAPAQSSKPITNVLGSRLNRRLPATGLGDQPLAIPFITAAVALAWFSRRRSSRRGV